MLFLEGLEVKLGLTECLTEGLTECLTGMEGLLIGEFDG